MHGFEKQTVVATRAAGIGGLAQTKRLHLRPLGARQNESVHAKLLSELESRTFRSVNPESQQTTAWNRQISSKASREEYGHAAALKLAYRLRRQNLKVVPCLTVVRQNV